MQDEPYKFTVIGKDLQDVSLSTADFLVHDGQMTFISNDKEGVLRLVDFDPAGTFPPALLADISADARPGFIQRRTISTAYGILRRSTSDGQ